MYKLHLLVVLSLLASPAAAQLGPVDCVGSIPRIEGANGAPVQEGQLFGIGLSAGPADPTPAVGELTLVLFTAGTAPAPFDLPALGSNRTRCPSQLNLPAFVTSIVAPYQPNTASVLMPAGTRGNLFAVQMLWGGIVAQPQRPSRISATAAFTVY